MTMNLQMKVHIAAFVISWQANSTRYFVWSECTFEVHGEPSQSTYECFEENIAISTWIIEHESNLL